MSNLGNERSLFIARNLKACSSLVLAGITGNDTYAYR
jgi:hypothetical protein